MALTRLALFGAATAIAALGATPTYHKEVLPILQRECQECHRPGEIGPFSLMSYSEARPWAKAIKNAVASKKMPPWFADEGKHAFSNQRKLSQAERPYSRRLFQCERSLHQSPH